jgi:hypothetical protein
MKEESKEPVPLNNTPQKEPPCQKEETGYDEMTEDDLLYVKRIQE